ncbi:error-prone DNA polymerase [Thalassotalea euphylliae]|uniref:Error-prone DNA polymerase n=1 Tax=Thalassotalea euphylliae TaxID=1655234 RepID=A0A3E0TX68_9GAMM|nr:error-prone DNA polymerase [Thalassotalea euphylliae]REL29311.1 DNA polymerase III subunit alpha [Thalassotalea euphylliae]
MSYSELFCQSNFSFLQGASHPEELILQARFLGYEALAITDECSVAGVVRAYTASKEHELNIKLIVGSMFWLNSELQLLLLCPSRVAYAELCRVITNARRRSEKGEYDLQEWDLMSLKHCLIIWLPTGQVCDQHWGSWLVKYHGKRLWLGVQRHLLNNEQAYLSHCEQLADKLELSITACGGVLMHTSERLVLQHTLAAISAGTTVKELGDKRLPNCERAMRSLAKLSKLFKPEWLRSSLIISELCQFNLSELRYEYPAELVPKKQKPMDYLRSLVKQGIAGRFPEGISTEISDTIEKELTLIEELNYPYYFLTIHDVVMFAKRQGILFQGRGSAANSIVCYCLGITSVDPRQISVLFERFISKERDEPPDIDVDFEHERREEVIQYIYQKYGRERTAIAATVITYRLKSAIREVGKALGINITQLEFFIKNINRRDRGLSWESQVIELGLNPKSTKGQQFISLVNEIRGFPRHLSQHVGGFVISAGPLYELVPIENASMTDRTVIQWDKDDLESLGLLKVDVLALGMLSAIRKCFDLVKDHYQRSLSIAEITKLKDDPKVYKLIQQADTVGLFQIESRAQMSMLPRLKPANYYDLVIQIAIVRPGPIQGDMVHPFLKRRDGVEAIEYPSEEVKEVLSRTLGVPIFQEQVIKLAMVAAGFTGGEADQLRRAMASWKKNGKLLQFKNKLISGMQARGYQAEFAEQIFNQILGFGEYGFPESHSASFAVLAYVSAWLKCYYPALFYASLLNSLPMGFYSASQLIQDAKRHKITILPVCVNHSYYDHKVVDYLGEKGLRLGLRIVKGFSQQSANILLSSRPEQGFKSINHIKKLGLNRYSLEQLASANAFHLLTGNRYQTRWQLMNQEDEMPLFSSLHSEPTRTEEIAVSSIAESAPEQVSFEFTPNEIDDLTEDYAATGLTLGKHPITLLAESGKLPKFTRMVELTNKAHKSMITVIGVVTGKQAPGTAGGVTFVTLEDDTGNINVVVWAATSRAQKQPYITAKILKVTGILEREGEVIHVIAGKLTDLTHELANLDTKSRDFH